MITTPAPVFYKSIHTKEEHHTAENIAKGIENIMHEIGINKFISVITDNANIMKAAWRILKEKYQNKIFLGCWAHEDLGENKSPEIKQFDIYNTANQYSEKESKEFNSMTVPNI
ncbi:3881_t:CDS:2 [Gigaspora margarita]|uniref:3881_t:CDS:1 n=1 Tax=Gigaspora margarita TaxID=4874 RepID=A0ABM8W0H6_GIGMA|nr:3881_t:CDS:2 [Gigaspora margarita]